MRLCTNKINLRFDYDLPNITPDNPLVNSFHSSYLSNYYHIGWGN